MVYIRMYVQGADKVNKSMIKLPKNLEKYGQEGIERLSNYIQRSAKARISKFSFTGTLAQSIYVRTFKRSVEVGTAVPWAAKMETGEGLPQVIPTTGNILIQEWLVTRYPQAFMIVNGKVYSRTGGYAGLVPVKKVTVRKHHPFMEPAVREGVERLPKLMKDMADKAIEESMR